MRHLVSNRPSMMGDIDHIQSTFLEVLDTNLDHQIWFYTRGTKTEKQQCDQLNASSLTTDMYWS